MATECAVCYVSDLNFLTPTLASATALRRFVPAHKADIFIIVIDEDETRLKELSRFTAPHAIQLLSMKSRSFSGFDAAKYSKTHVPPSTLGRFFMDDILPASCKRIVYLDGDTWILKDPSALIEAVVPEGKLAAMDDMGSFCRNDITPHGKTTKAYLDGLGIKKGAGYFNAGVFAASRATWRKMASEAYSFFLENTILCKYHDQSAMNAVIGDRRIYLSARWNFQTPYKFWGVEGGIQPNIYHFTQSPKPWQGICTPWQALYAPYQDFIREIAPLGLPVAMQDSAYIIERNRIERNRFLKLRTLFLPRLLAKKLQFRAYERKAWI